MWPIGGSCRYGSAAEVAEDVHRLLSARPASSTAAARRLARLHRRLWARAGSSLPIRAPAEDADEAPPGATWTGSRFYLQVDERWEDMLGFRLFETRALPRAGGGDGGNEKAAAAAEGLEGEGEVEGREWYSAKELVPKGGLAWDKQA